jgi:hypothetical protein
MQACSSASVAVAQRALLETIPIASGVSRVVFDGDLAVVGCRPGDVGTADATIALRPRGRSLDVHALRRYLSSFAVLALEHEDVAAQIAADVAAVCGCRVVVALVVVVDDDLARTVRAVADPSSGRSAP